MRLRNHDYKFLRTVTHQGAIFGFASQQSRKDPDLWEIGYSVLDLTETPGQEVDAWKDFKTLDFNKELRPAGVNLITVKYKDGVPADDVPFFVVSDASSIFVFRQSSTKTLLVDRFVYDLASTTLNNAWEVRYRRSKKIDTPASSKDTFGSTDMEGQRFLEPSNELGFVDDLRDGRFAAAILPTELAGVERWVIVAPTADGKTQRTWSIARAPNGMFDLEDAIDPDTETVPPDTTFALTDGQAPLPAVSAPALLLYAKQERLKDAYGRFQLLKKETRAMLSMSVGSDRKIAVVDLGVGKDGRIAQVQGELPVSDAPAIGNALHFDAPMRTMARLPSIGSDGGAAALSIEFWIRASGQSGAADPVIVSAGDAEANGVKPFAVALVEDAIVFEVEGEAVASEPLEPDIWTHVAGTWTTGEAPKLHVDGVASAKNATAPEVNRPKSGYRLGAFNGALGLLRLWDVPLDREQIVGLMGRRVTSADPLWPNLLGDWPFAAPDGLARLSSIPNVSSAGKAGDGTLLGATWIPTDVPMGASMHPVAWDDHGLSATALMLHGATEDAPGLMEGSDGLVHLYARESGSDALVAYQYDTYTARAQYATRWIAEDPDTPSNTQHGTLRFMARTPGTGMNYTRPTPAPVTIKVDDAETCSVTMRHYTGLTEVWPKMPRKVQDFLAILNGDAIQKTDDPVAAARDAVMYDYHAVQVSPSGGYSGVVPGPGVGSGVFSVVNDRVADNGKTALVEEAAGFVPLVRAGVDCWWISENPIATVAFAGQEDADSVALIADDKIADYKGPLNLRRDLSIEAWVAPSAQPRNDARIVAFNNPDKDPDQKAAYTLGLDEFLRPFAATPGLSMLAVNDQLPLDRWSHIAATYKTDFGIELSGTRYMDAGDDESTSSGDAVTIEAWVRPDALGGLQVVASKWDRTLGQSWRLYLASDGTPTFQVQQVTGTKTRVATATGARKLETGKWHHVAGVYDVAFKKETAIQFHASDQSYVRIPALTAPPETAVTVEAWVYLVSDAPGRRVVIYTADADQAVIFNLELEDQKPAFYVDTATASKEIKSPDALLKERWYHLSGTYDPDQGIALYINGLAVPTSSVIDLGAEHPPAEPPGSVPALEVRDEGKTVYSVGGFATNQSFDGWINELRIWNRALSIDEVRHNLKIPLSGGERGLVGYWPFQDRFGDSAMDLAGTSNGTLVSAKYIQVQKGFWVHKVIVDHDLDDGIRVEDTVSMADSHLLMGAETSDAAVNFLQGAIDEVRLWKTGRMDWEVLYYLDRRVPKSAEGLVALYPFETGKGKVGFDQKGQNNAVIRDDQFELTDEAADAMWIPTTFGAGWSLYVNGAPVATEPFAVPSGMGSAQARVGAMAVGGAVGKFYPGKLNELRLWNTVRTEAQIRDNAFRPLTGTEAGLVGYWPFAEGNGDRFGDKTGGGANGSWEGIEDPVWSLSMAPVGLEGPDVRPAIGGIEKPMMKKVSGSPGAGEYGFTEEVAGGELSASMNRSYLFIDTDKALNMTTGYTIGELDLQFISQVQTNPTIIGYIEGAPPVPAENMLAAPGSTPSAKDFAGISAVTLNESDEFVQIYSASRDTGFDMSIDAKLGAQFESKTEAGLVVSTLLFGFISKIGVHTSFEHTLSWLNDASFTTTGTKTHKNSYQVTGGWYDNKYRVGNGEGYIYYPENWGYALVNSGTADMYAMRLKDTGALVSYTLIPNPDIPIDVNVIQFRIDDKYTKNGTLDGYIGFEKDDGYKELPVGERGSYFKPLQAYALKQQIDRQFQQLRAYYDEFDALSIGQRANTTQFQEGDIGAGNTNIGNVLMGIEGNDDLSNEEWKAQVARRNLVNTYVWTAEGGFYAEEEQFSAMRESSMGGSYYFKGVAGVYTEMGMSTGIHFELDALFGGHIRTVAKKTSREGNSYGLTSSVTGNRSIGFPEIGKQTVAMPGKVRGYRFMSFYLAPSKRNFDQFSGVVDQQWLNSQGDYAGVYDPDAFALRQALTRPNEVWRALHRVTYVSRAPDQSHDEGEAIPLKVARPDPESIASNALLLARLPKTARRMGPVSVALSKVLETLEKDPLWGPLLAAEDAEIRADITEYLRGYYEI